LRGNITRRWKGFGKLLKKEKKKKKAKCELSSLQLAEVNLPYIYGDNRWRKAFESVDSHGRNLKQTDRTFDRANS
jgi:hypothetical protein